MKLNRQFLLGLTLFTLVFSIYVATFNGRFIVVDEFQIYDSAESLVQRGDTSMNYDFHRIGIPGRFAGWSDGLAEICGFENGDPWQDAKYEFLVHAMIAPLIEVGLNIPYFGNIHLVLFFNIFVTAFTAVSIFWLGRQLGYSDTSAWITGLLFAVGTIALFYARQLYRDPLAGFFVLWVFGIAMLINNRDVQKRIPWKLIAALIIAIFLALFTKIVVLLLFPAAIIILFAPILQYLYGTYRLQFVGLLLCLFGLAGFILIGLQQEWFGYGENYDFSSLLEQFTSIDNYIISIEALLGYQIGLSRGLWIYNPALWLGLYGAYLLWQRNQKLAVIILAMNVIGFGYFQGLIRQGGWGGSWAWGPRYLVPIIPTLMLLWVTPAVEKLLSSRSGIIIISVVGLIGLAVQFFGISVPLSNYYTDVFRAGEYYDYGNPEAYDRTWMGAHWNPEWMPLVYHIERFEWEYINIAWNYGETIFLPLTLVFVLSILSIDLAYNVLSKDEVDIKKYRVFAPLIVVLCIGTIFATLFSLRNDPRYVLEGSDGTVVRQLVRDLNDEVDSDAVIFVDREQYKEIFMNYAKVDATIAFLPYPPAQFGRGATLDDPIEDQIGSGTVCAIDWAVQQENWLWLAASSGPYSPGDLRPIERYLTYSYFPVDSIEHTQLARGIRYIAVEAPENLIPEISFETTFGEEIMLKGIDLPLGNEYEAGDGIPVSLVWQALETPSSDYNIGLYLIDSNGVVHSQRDSQPNDTFGNMLTWQTSDVIRDNHGLVIPDNLQPGTYTLQLSVYRWQDLTRLVNENGEEVITLATITVK